VQPAAQGVDRATGQRILKAERQAGAGASEPGPRRRGRFRPAQAKPATARAMIAPQAGQ
jgi:hypothetical protein